MKKYNKQSGYTIIETMIATSLFLVVITIGMGSLLNANFIHQKSRDMRSIMDNLSFIMEDMSRNIRTGTDFRCLTGSDSLINVVSPLSCQDGWGIAFEYANGDIENDNDQWVYYIDNTGKIFKSTTGPYTIQSNFVQLTPDEVVIDPLSSFSVLGGESVSSGDQQQPLVTVRLIGSITSRGVVTPFFLQTS